MPVAEERNQGGDGEEDMAGEAPRGVNRGRADDDEGGDGDSQPQIIPSRGLNEWLLLGVLEDTFEPNKFKIEMRSDSYKVWAPRRLGSQELQRCRSKGTK